jgi:hypothetical protein
MSTNLILNQNTNIQNDNCFSEFKNFCNDKIFRHSFIPNLNNNDNYRDIYINSTDIRGIIQNNNYDIKGISINESTSLRNGGIENTGSRRELETRIFPGAPYMARGQSVLHNTDLSSRLQLGEDTRTSKSANALSSYSADNFIPLVPSLAENVQNIDHIIPTYWVRGGMSSRSVVRNIDYLKTCGFKQ